MAAPVAAGLAAGIALIAVFAIWSANPQINKNAPSKLSVSNVIITEEASSSQTVKTFDPKVIRVVIGTNNTVRWTNRDTIPSSVIADNAGEDPDFAAAAQSPPRKSENFIMPGQSFNFTFNQPGEIHYHSEPHPWMQGTVIVLPPKPQDVAALPCENVIILVKSNETLYTCLHPPEFKPASPIVLSLPAPTYRMVECTSTYGCSHRYNYEEIIPPNLLSDGQRKQVLDKVMSLPEVKMNAGWKLDHFIVQPRADKWTADIQLFMDGIKQLPPSQDCGLYGQVDLDLETLDIQNVNNIPPKSNVKCDASSGNHHAVSLTISGLKDTYKVGEIIDVSATQTGGGCGLPNIIIQDYRNGQTVLTRNGTGVFSCPVLTAGQAAKFSMTWTPSSQRTPIIMNQTGTYMLIAEYGTASVEQKFTVVK
jgi:plastocyanin